LIELIQGAVKGHSDALVFYQYSLILDAMTKDKRIPRFVIEVARIVIRSILWGDKEARRFCGVLTDRLTGVLDDHEPDNFDEQLDDSEEDDDDSDDDEDDEDEDEDEDGFYDSEVDDDDKPQDDTGDQGRVVGLKSARSHESADAKMEKRPRFQTPLHQAVRTRIESVVKMILEKHVPVNAVDDEGYTPLHIALLGGHPGIIKLLLD